MLNDCNKFYNKLKMCLFVDYHPYGDMPPPGVGQEVNGLEEGSQNFTFLHLQLQHLQQLQDLQQPLPQLQDLLQPLPQLQDLQQPLPQLQLILLLMDLQGKSYASTNSLKVPVIRIHYH